MTDQHNAKNRLAETLKSNAEINAAQDVLDQSCKHYPELIMEDVAMAKAIAEGKDSENVGRDEIFELFER
jgi:hypothetical protein